MKIVKHEFVNEIIIEKSRFITHLFRVNDIDEANKHIADIKKRHWDANHNCVALIIGTHGEIMRSSDDGEPSKTAGIPMLEVLKKNNITNTLAITTRYFGGIKLGAGGLVRAYSKSVSDAIKKANFIEIRILKQYQLKSTYSYHTIVENLLKEKTNLLDIIYSDIITYIFAINDESILDKLSDITLGKAEITYQGEISVDVDV